MLPIKATKHTIIRLVIKSGMFDFDAIGSTLFEGFILFINALFL